MVISITMKEKELKVEYPGTDGNIVIEGDALRVEVKPVEVIQLYSNTKLLLSGLKTTNERVVTLALGRLEAIVNSIELRS